MRKLFFILILVIFSSYLFKGEAYGQCLVEKTSLSQATAYTLRDVSIYDLKHDLFEIKTKVEKIIIHNGDLNKISYNIIFTVSGNISYSFIPDLAEIITADGSKISLYIPNHNSFHVIGNYIYCECYQSYDENAVEVQNLEKEPISSVILKNDNHSLVLQPSSDIFISMFNCLENKD